MNLNHWIKQHGAGERSFARGLRGFFEEQADRIASAAENFQAIGPETIAMVFNEETEHEALQPVLQRNVSRLAMIGATDQLRLIQDASEPRKGVDDVVYQQAVEEFIESIPQPVRDRIRVAVDEAFEQDYWRDITASIGKDLRAIIQQAHDEGDPNSRIAATIKRELGGTMARRRALRISRTETTNAMNSGHDAVYQQLEQDGSIRGKQWLAIADDDVRQTHIDNDGVVVRAAESFQVGGYSAPWPGHWSLPAQERVHCRCTTIGVLT
ncbi:phage minor head protein [Aeoliella sp.]|uniref:phage minor head protein n=1 Tax=Aeoliella sp. TaxID=2795800 RepID=UPI003CCB8591